MPLRGDRETANVSLAEQQVIMINQPRAGARHQFDRVENGGRLPTQIGHQSAFGMRGEFAALEQPEGRGMMLEQGAAAPAIEGPDRGDPGRHAVELPAEMIEDPRRNELHGVERPAGHFEEADLQGEGQPVQGAPPLPNRGEFARVEREEMRDLECRQCLGKPFLTEITMLPPMGRRLFRRTGYGVRNGGAPMIWLGHRASGRRRYYRFRCFTNVRLYGTCATSSETKRCAAQKPVAKQT